MARLLLSDRVVDLVTGEVVGHGTLRPVERALLAWLAEHPDRGFTLHELHVEVWGFVPTVNSRAAYSCIYRVRSLIEPDPQHPVHLLADRRDGYRLAGARVEGDSVVRRSSNVPAPADPLVGRQAELARLQALDPLLTLVGPGGVGKSRLVAELAQRLTLPGGFWVADLGAATTEAALLDRVARALPGRPAADSGAIGAALASLGRCIVAFDNAEDAHDGLGAQVSAWRAAAPELRVLVAGRRRLGLPGEQVVELAPLPPAEAATLLVDRVRRRSPAMASTLDPAACASLVVATDALPLAIEIAAANVALVGADVVLAALRRADGLRARSTGDPRHHTLDAVVQNSWDRLSPELRRVLATLAAVDGPLGFAALEGLDLGDPAGDVADLVDASLVVVEPASPGPVVRILVTIRALVRRVAPVPIDPILEGLASWVEAAWARERGEERVPCVLPRPVVHGLSSPTVRQLADASRRTRTRERHRTLLRVLAAVAFDDLADPELASVLTEEALALEPLPAEAAGLRRLRASTLKLRGDPDGAVIEMQLAGELALDAGLPGLAAHVQYDIATTLTNSHRFDEADRAVAGLLQLTRELPEASATAGQAGALTLESVLAEYRGERERADRCAARAMAAFVRGGFPMEAAIAACQRGQAAFAAEQPEQAMRWLDEARHLLAPIELRHASYVLGWVLTCRGLVLRSLGRYVEALEALAAATVANRRSSRVDASVDVLIEEGSALADLGRTAEAIERFDAVLRLPAFNANLRIRSAMTRVELAILVDGPARAGDLAAAITAETEGVGSDLDVWFRLLEARCRFGHGDLRRAYAALAPIQVPDRARHPPSAHLLQRAELLLRLGRRELAREDLALLETHDPGSLARERIRLQRELMDAIDGAAAPPTDEPTSSDPPEWAVRNGGWLALASAWTRAVRSGEPPDVSRIEVSPLSPDLVWAVEEARAGGRPAWTRGARAG